MLLEAPSVASSASFARVSQEMADVVGFLSARGWTPATSSNFSARVPDHDGAIAISRSGVDKSTFTASDVILIDERGEVIWPEGARSSAETLIHTTLYALFDAAAVLHTHSIHATAFSMLHGRDGVASFAGLELLKGLAGITTHDTRVEIPIFPNDQDMDRFSRMLHDELSGTGRRAFVVEGHGLYTWGDSLKEAQRHVEVFEYLFELSLLMEGRR